MARTTLQRLLISARPRLSWMPVCRHSDVVIGGLILGRRNVQSSVYDKNLEEEGTRVGISEKVGVASETQAQIMAGVTAAEKSWVPHPETGVFVPQDKAAEAQPHTVVEEQIWFRPDEDVQREPSS